MRIVILGAGASARETLDIFEACNQAGAGYDVLGFVVDAGHGEPGTLVNEHSILGDIAWLANNRAVHVICAVGAPALRRRMVEHVAALGLPFCNAIHPAAHLTRWVTLGQGVIVAAGSVLTNQVRVGDHAHVNVGCTVSHDVTLGPYATLAPGVHLAGGVAVGAGSELGVGANVIPRVVIGEWAVVGAGCTVIRDVPANTTVVGVPGRVIATHAPGWETTGEPGRACPP
jgi:sugar O-acyltransferase (sialic acid O-acetyltransferase NeuD family)